MAVTGIVWQSQKPQQKSHSRGPAPEHGGKSRLRRFGPAREPGGRLFGERPHGREQQCGKKRRGIEGLPAEPDGVDEGQECDGGESARVPSEHQDGKAPRGLCDVARLGHDGLGDGLVGADEYAQKKMDTDEKIRVGLEEREGEKRNGERDEAACERLSAEAVGKPPDQARAEKGARHEAARKERGFGEREASFGDVRCDHKARRDGEPAVECGRGGERDDECVDGRSAHDDAGRVDAEKASVPEEKRAPCGVLTDLA